MTKSEIMVRIKSSSSIEILPKYMRGLYLRKHPLIYGKPDFGNKSRKIVLFIDGCFWHKCNRHFNLPKTNIAFWKNKISKNVKRDKLVNKTLRKNGFKIIRIWEHNL